MRNVPKPVVGQAFSAFGIAIRNGFKMDAAKPSYQGRKGKANITWDDLFVEELKRSLYACAIL